MKPLFFENAPTLKKLSLWCEILFLSLLLSACASPPNTGNGANVPPTVLLKDEPSDIMTLKALHVNLTTTISLLENNKLDEARLAFKKFDNRWFDVLLIIRANSKESFRHMDDTVKSIEQKLLPPDITITPGNDVIPLLKDLEEDFNTFITKLAPGNVVDSQNQKVQPLTVEEVEFTSIKVREFLAEKSDLLLQRALDLKEALKNKDLAKVKSSYENARFEFEQIEFLAGAFKDFNIALDGRPEQMVKGENDPNWTGFHPIEKAVYQEEKLDNSVEDKVDKLIQDLKSFQAEIKVRTLLIKPALAVTGAASLIEEILSNKITGEEERYSHTDLIDFKANLVGARYVYSIFSPYVHRVNPELDDQILNSFTEVQDIITPYFQPNNQALDYTLVSAETRKLFAQKVEGLADAFSKVSGTLGLKT